MRFRFVLTREEFLDLFLDDLELPDLAGCGLAEAEHEGIRRAGYAVTGSPANLSVNRTSAAGDGAAAGLAAAAARRRSNNWRQNSRPARMRSGERR